MRTIEFEDCIFSFDDSEEMKNKVFEAVIDWFTEQEQFSGECITQCDNAIIDAPNFMAHLADDVIQFEYTEK